MDRLPETDPENARIVAALREIFAPIGLRLTPEIEPATVYAIAKEPAQ